MSRIAYPLLVILLGAVLRVAMLAQDVRFQPDEALYASFARQISVHGDFFLRDAPLDKPPLALLVVAASFTMFGPTEFAARLPSIFASILTLAAVYALARRLYNPQTALLAMLLLALSPLDLAFAATAFVDPLLTLFVLWACLDASRDRWGSAGMFMALAIATKQSALQFIPLMIALGMARNVKTAWSWREGWRRFGRAVIPMVLGGIILTAWSGLRAAPTDFWTLGAYNNNPGRFIRANEILPRLNHWLNLLQNVTGFWPLLLLSGIPLLTAKRSRDAVIDLCIATFVLAWLLAYWLIAFNTYDRYLHTLGLLLLILVARGLIRLAR